MMAPEVRDAVESACTVTVKSNAYAQTRYTSPERIRAIVLAVVRELPDDMTVAELRDELEIANNQGPL